MARSGRRPGHHGDAQDVAHFLLHAAAMQARQRTEAVANVILEVADDELRHGSLIA
jgi:hypothetical protein